MLDYHSFRHHTFNLQRAHNPHLEHAHHTITTVPLDIPYLCIKHSIKRIHVVHCNGGQCVELSRLLNHVLYNVLNNVAEDVRRHLVIGICVSDHSDNISINVPSVHIVAITYLDHDNDKQCNLYNHAVVRFRPAETKKLAVS